MAEDVPGSGTATALVERPASPVLPRPPETEFAANARFALRVAVAALSFLVMVGSGLAWATYRDFSATIPRGNPVPALAPGAKDIDGRDQNILLLGNDTRADATPQELQDLSTGLDGDATNTDTMMVLHLPAGGGKPTIVSFPRDSWVQIPENGNGKLNSAYADGYVAVRGRGGDELARQSGGIDMVIKTISGLTGLHIDHYLQVDLLGFYRISNAIGGVDVCLNQPQNASTDRDEFGSGYSGIDLPAGHSLIKGKQALAFVRQRHGLPRGDLDRITRQQYFLEQAFKKIVSGGVLLNPFKLRALLKAVSSSMIADPALNLVSLGRQLATLSPTNVRFMTLPNNGPQVIYPDGVETAIVEVDKSAIPGFLNELQGKAADPALGNVTAAAPSSVTLDVLNGTSVAGLAGANADALRQGGFTVDTVDSADPTSATTIKYPDGQQAAAKAVLAQVPGAVLQNTATVQRVTLVLGTDGRQVASLIPAAPAPVTSAAAPAVPAAPAPAAALSNCVN